MKQQLKLLLLFLVILGNSLYAQTDAEAITSGDNKIEWAYYFKKDSQESPRWFISSTVDKSDTIDVYSLMPIKDGKPGWARVSKDVATLDLEGSSISIATIEDNPTFEYYDAGWGEKTTDPKIQDDIELIRNSSVDIRWWFFKASNGSWYIINKNGTVHKFASKDGQYDWQEIDMGEYTPEFYVDSGVKGVRFGDGEDKEPETNANIVNHNGVPFDITMLETKVTLETLPKAFCSIKNQLTILTDISESKIKEIITDRFEGFKFLGVDSVHGYIFEFNETKYNIKSIRDELKDIENIGNIFLRSYIGDDSIKLLSEPNDSYTDTNQDLNKDYLEALNMYEAWDIETGNRNVPIAICTKSYQLENNQLFKHKDIQDNISILNGSKKALENYQTETKQNIEYMNHGISMAGVIGGKTNNSEGISGINWDTTILIGEVMYCLIESTKINDKIIVSAWEPDHSINDSLGIKRVLFTHRKNIINPSDKNLYIFAAGNTNVDTNIFNGSMHYNYENNQYTLDKLDNLIIVAGYKTIPKLFNSNYGESVDIAAPIVNSSTIMDHKYTNEFGGTSSSSAVVAGVASLIYSINKDLKPAEVKQIILESASEYITQDNQGIELKNPIPILDAKKALEDALDTVTPPSIIEVKKASPSFGTVGEDPFNFEVELSGEMKKGYGVYLNLDERLMGWEDKLSKKFTCEGTTCKLEKIIDSIGYFGMRIARVGIFKDDDLSNTSDSDYHKTFIEFTVGEKEETNEEETNEEITDTENCIDTKEGCKEPIQDEDPAKDDDPVEEEVTNPEDNNDNCLNPTKSGGCEDLVEEPVVIIPKVTVSLSTDTVTLGEPITAYAKFTSDLPVGYSVKIGYSASSTSSAMYGGQKEWSRGLSTNFTGTYQIYFNLYKGDILEQNLGSKSYTINPLLPPENIQASDGIYTKEIKLTWDKVDEATRYYIYRAESPSGEYKYLRYMTILSYEDSNVEDDKKYYYKIKSYNSKADKSADSKIDEGYTKVVIVPLDRVSNIQATQGTLEDKVKINWTSVDRAETYYISRGANSSNLQPLDITSSDYFYDRTAEDGVKYYYKVEAYSAKTGKGPSSFITSGYSKRRLSPPYGLYAEDGKDRNEIYIQWTSNGSSNYYLERSAHSSYGYTQIADITSRTFYTDTDVDSGSKYFYRVRAYSSSAITSTYSNVDEGSTRAIEEDTKEEEPVKIVDAKPTLRFINDINYIQANDFTIDVRAEDDIALRNMGAVLKYNGDSIKVLGKTTDISSTSNTEGYFIDISSLAVGREYEFAVGVDDSNGQIASPITKKFKVVNCDFNDIDTGNDEQWWANDVIELCKAGIVEGYEIENSQGEREYRAETDATGSELLKVINYSSDFSGTSEQCLNTSTSDNWSDCHIKIANQYGFSNIGGTSGVTRGLAFRYVVKAFWGVNLSEMASYNWLSSEGIIRENNSDNNDKFIRRSELAGLAVETAKHLSKTLGK